MRLNEVRMCGDQLAQPAVRLESKASSALCRNEAPMPDLVRLLSLAQRLPDRRPMRRERGNDIRPLPPKATEYAWVLILRRALAEKAVDVSSSKYRSDANPPTTD